MFLNINDDHNYIVDFNIFFLWKYWTKVSIFLTFWQIMRLNKPSCDRIYVVFFRNKDDLKSSQTKEQEVPPSGEKATVLVLRIIRVFYILHLCKYLSDFKKNLSFTFLSWGLPWATPVLSLIFSWNLHSLWLCLRSIIWEWYKYQMRCCLWKNFF